MKKSTGKATRSSLDNSLAGLLGDEDEKSSPIVKSSGKSHTKKANQSSKGNLKLTSEVTDAEFYNNLSKFSLDEDDDEDFSLSEDDPVNAASLVGNMDDLESDLFGAMSSSSAKPASSANQVTAKGLVKPPDPQTKKKSSKFDFDADDPLAGLGLSDDEEVIKKSNSKRITKDPKGTIKKNENSKPGLRRESSQERSTDHVKGDTNISPDVYIEPNITTTHQSHDSKQTDSESKTNRRSKLDKKASPREKQSRNKISDDLFDDEDGFADDLPGLGDDDIPSKKPSKKRAILSKQRSTDIPFDDNGDEIVAPARSALDSLLGGVKIESKRKVTKQPSYLDKILSKSDSMEEPNIKNSPDLTFGGYSPSSATSKATPRTNTDKAANSPRRAVRFSEQVDYSNDLDIGSARPRSAPDSFSSGRKASSIEKTDSVDNDNESNLNSSLRKKNTIGRRLSKETQQSDNRSNSIDGSENVALKPHTLTNAKPPNVVNNKNSSKVSTTLSSTKASSKPNIDDWLGLGDDLTDSFNTNESAEISKALQDSPKPAATPTKSTPGIPEKPESLDFPSTPPTSRSRRQGRKSQLISASIDDEDFDLDRSLNHQNSLLGSDALDSISPIVKQRIPTSITPRKGTEIPKPRLDAPLLSTPTLKQTSLQALNPDNQSMQYTQRINTDANSLNNTQFQQQLKTQENNLAAQLQQQQQVMQNQFQEQQLAAQKKILEQHQQQMQLQQQQQQQLLQQLSHDQSISGYQLSGAHPLASSTFQQRLPQQHTPYQQGPYATGFDSSPPVDSFIHSLRAEISSLKQKIDSKCIDTTNKESFDIHQKLNEAGNKLRIVESERDHLLALNKVLIERHKEEIKNQDESHKNHIKLFEESHERREEKLKVEADSYHKQMINKITSLASEREELIAMQRKKISLSIESTDEEIKRIKDKHEKTLRVVTEDCENRIEKLKQIKDKEVLEIMASRSQGKSLSSIVDQVQATVQEVGHIKHKIETSHSNTHEERTASLQARDDFLKSLQERLHQQEAENERERNRLQGLIAKLEVQLREQMRTTEKERWEIMQERNRLEEMRVNLKEERSTYEGQLATERASLNRARDKLLVEQREILGECLQDKRELTTERGQLKLYQDEASEAAKKASASSLEKQKSLDQLALRLRQESEDIASRQSNVKIEEDRIKQLKDEFQKKEEAVKSERDTIEKYASEIRTKAKEIETVAEESTRLYQEGSQALERSSAMKLELANHIQVLENKTLQIQEAEKRLSEQRLLHLREQKELELSRHNSRCSECQGLLTAKKKETKRLDVADDRPIPATPNHVETSIKPHSTKATPDLILSSLQYNRQLRKWSADNDMDNDFIEEEQRYLEMLQTKRKTKKNTWISQNPLQPN